MGCSVTGLMPAVIMAWTWCTAWVAAQGRHQHVTQQSPVPLPWPPMNCDRYSCMHLYRDLVCEADAAAHVAQEARQQRAERARGAARRPAHIRIRVAKRAGRVARGPQAWRSMSGTGQRGQLFAPRFPHSSSVELCQPAEAQADVRIIFDDSIRYDAHSCLGSGALVSHNSTTRRIARQQRRRTCRRHA